MLRAVVLTLGALLMIAGILISVIDRHFAGIQLVVFGAIIIAGTLFERWRYRREDQGRPDGRWQATGERFADPHTGATLAVFYDAQTGERRYVSEAPNDAKREADR